MAKTYQNRQPGPEVPVNEAFEDVNKNSQEANDDLADLYSKNNTLEYNLNQKNQETNERMSKHVDGEEERHTTDDVQNTTPVTGSDLTQVITNLKNQIEAVVAGGTEVDARVSQALVDLVGTVWPNFKNLQDYWQEREAIFDHRSSKYIVVKKEISQEGIPRLVYEEVT